MVAEDATKPSLLDLARQRKPKRSECGVARILRTHSRTDEIAELITAMNQREISFSVGEAVLREAEIYIRADSLSRHARRKCSCDA